MVYSCQSFFALTPNNEIAHSVAKESYKMIKLYTRHKDMEKLKIFCNLCNLTNASKKERLWMKGGMRPSFFSTSKDIGMLPKWFSLRLWRWSNMLMNSSVKYFNSIKCNLNIFGFYIRFLRKISNTSTYRYYITYMWKSIHICAIDKMSTFHHKFEDYSI